MYILKNKGFQEEILEVIQKYVNVYEECYFNLVDLAEAAYDCFNKDISSPYMGWSFKEMVLFINRADFDSIFSNRNIYKSPYLERILCDSLNVIIVKNILSGTIVLTSKQTYKQFCTGHRPRKKDVYNIIMLRDSAREPKTLEEKIIDAIFGEE